MRDEESFDNVNNLDMDSNNTYFESEANITARANLTVEVSVQNSEVAANDSNNATLSNITTSKLKDLLATVMAAVQAGSTKQTAAFQTEVVKLTETLKAHLKKKLQTCHQFN